MRLLTLLFFVSFFGFYCSNSSNVTKVSKSKPPNILWIVAEDLSDYIPSFGDSTVVTPNISRLAKEGICYDRFFSPAAVCAPARSAIATGMYPTHIGTNHMRTGPWFISDMPQSFIDNYQKGMPEGIPVHEAVPPPDVKMMSEVLREHGYYCSNNRKEDYQFRRSLMAWDDCSQNAHWRNRKEGQPFFSIFNINVTHESQIWQKANDSLWINEDLEIPVPPYLPNTEIGKKDIRRMYSNIKEMDHRVGEIIAELEQDGLLDETIIFWYTDHGGPLPRQKRLLYDSGIKVPMVIRFPDKKEAGTRNNGLISFIDLAPTVMSLAGIEPNDKLDGKSFLGPFGRSEKANYIFAASDRFDESYDKIRAVRDERFKYIRYYEPEKPMFLHVNYRDQMPIMQELYRLKDSEELTEAQQLWFRESKPDEELFDIENDPFELNNLADNPSYSEKLVELRNALSKWQEETPDRNFKPERDLIQSIMPEGKQQVTSPPSYVHDNNHITLECKTEGASIGYQLMKNESDSLTNIWIPYTDPITIKEDESVHVVAHRLGFVPSDVVVIEP